MFVSAVLFAAGASTRFGSPKLLASVDADGTPMIRKVLETWTSAPFDEVIVVIGSDREALGEEILGFFYATTVRVVKNPRWTSGMFSSVKAGVAAVDVRSTHVAVSPADLPFLREEFLRTILSAAASVDSRTLVVPTHSGRRGHPLLFSSSLVSRILSWPDDRRLSDLLREPDLTVLHLEGFDEGILRDIDRREDLLRREDGPASAPVSSPSKKKVFPP